MISHLQDPHDPWFLTGVTTPGTFLQSTLGALASLRPFWYRLGWYVLGVKVGWASCTAWCSDDLGLGAPFLAHSLNSSLVMCENWFKPFWYVLAGFLLCSSISSTRARNTPRRLVYSSVPVYCNFLMRAWEKMLVSFESDSTIA